MIDLREFTKIIIANTTQGFFFQDGVKGRWQSHAYVDHDITFIFNEELKRVFLAWVYFQKFERVPKTTQFINPLITDHLSYISVTGLLDWFFDSIAHDIGCIQPYSFEGDSKPIYEHFEQLAKKEIDSKKEGDCDL